MGAMTLVLLVLAGGSEWKKADTAGGIDVFMREPANERFAELKLVTTASSSVRSLCDAAYGGPNVVPGEPAVVSRKVIKETHGKRRSERVTYEQVTPPMVSARDFGLRKTMEMLPTGVCRISFSAANDLAPPLPHGFVRIEKLRGSWEFEAVGSTTRLTYTIFSDPGGDIPAAFVHNGLKHAAVDWVKFVLQTAERSAAVASVDPS